MVVLLEQTLARVDGLEVRAQAVDAAIDRGHRALRLEDGLALIPGFPQRDAIGEAMIAAEGSAYRRIAFRAFDIINHELAYATLHNSGR